MLSFFLCNSTFQTGFPFNLHCHNNLICWNIPSQSACSFQHPVWSEFLLQSSYPPGLWNANAQLYHPSGEVWLCDNYYPAHHSTPASASAITTSLYEMITGTLCATKTKSLICSNTLTPEAMYAYSNYHASSIIYTFLVSNHVWLFSTYHSSQFIPDIDQPDTPICLPYFKINIY